VESVDGAAAHGLLPTPVFVQIGAGSYEPRHCGWARSLSRHEFASHLDGAELVISHAGAGVIGQCIQRRKVPLVVPRLKEAGEVVDDHQAATADRLAREGLIVLCGDISRLASFAEAAKRAQESNPWASAEGTKRPTASEVLMRALEA
jgi:UDP-N-acetylglucosamine transferase subunit ALG13